MAEGDKPSISFQDILNDQKSIEQIKNLKIQLEQFVIKNNNISSSSNPEFFIENEQNIYSIISKSLLENEKYFINSKDKSFSYELLIYCLLEKIKSKLSVISNSSKSIEDHLFHKVNINAVKNIKSFLFNFLISFYDLDNNEISDSNIEKTIETIINNKSIIEESFLISSAKIILILNIILDKNKIKNTFNEKIMTNTSLVNDLIVLLIKILNKLIIIKKNIDCFNLVENNDKNTNTNQNNPNDNFKLLLNKTYDVYEPNLMKLLFDIIFSYNLEDFFTTIIKNDDSSKIILNSLSFNKIIRGKLIKFINEYPFFLDKYNQKDLLNVIKNNNSITILFNYISDDLKDKKYTEIPELLEELQILYTFYLLTNSNDDIIIEKKIIQMLNNNFNINITKEDKKDTFFNNFINDIYKLSRNIPKNRFKVYNFLLLIFDSMKNFRKIISEIFFNNMKGNLEEYLEMTKKTYFFNLFIKNISNSESEVLDNFFNFLYSINREEYLPENEIIQIIAQIRFFKDIKLTQILIDNLKNFTDINYKSKNKDKDIDIFENDDESSNHEDDNLKKNENKEKKDIYLEKYDKFTNHIYKSYNNVLFNIISDIKNNNNSQKKKPAFDTKTSNTNSANITSDNNSNLYISYEILNILFDYLGIILKEKQILQYFISQNFLELFPLLVDDENYKRIAYKIIDIFLNASNNEEKLQEKNKQQIMAILNRFNLFFPKDEIQEEKSGKKYDELYKLKEYILMIESIQIYFNKKLLNNNQDKGNDDIENLNEKISKLYLFYSEYLNNNSKIINKLYNNDYHSLIKNYIDIIYEIIYLLNQNIISKNDIFYPNDIKKNLKKIIYNIFNFYSSSSEKNKYLLDFIKYFIDKSLNLIVSEDKNSNNNNKILENEQLSEKDFTLFYINKYKIKPEILKDSNDNKNKSIISNFCIQSPMMILSVLKVLIKNKKYLNQFLQFILFLCKINQQNIVFLLKQNLLKKLFKIMKEVPSSHDIIFKIFNLSFKYLQKNEICFIFEQLIQLLNTDEINVNNLKNKDWVKEILHCITKSLRILSTSSNNYSKGIILSKYKIKQPNIHNILEINNLKFNINKNMNTDNNILIRQEIYFYKSLKIKKLILLRLENQKNDEFKNREEKINQNNYIEISFRNQKIKVTENSSDMKYDDLSNFNSIFIDEDEDDKDSSDFNNYIEINKKNIIIYIFKESTKKLLVYINGHKVISYKYSFQFSDKIKAKIGFPLDLVKDVDDIKFKLFNHIKLKTLKIFLQNNETREIIENEYQLIIGKISCDYLFADELTNFKLDENTKLISKYNNIYSVKMNSIFNKCFVKSQLYNKIFFTEILLSNSLDYLFRIEKYIFILLNYLNIDKIIFNELISLLSLYLIINENFIQKFLSKEEFSSCLYFSLLRNVKFFDKETIENLLSIILINNNINNNKIINNIIISILLDVKIFDSLNHQIKYELINLIKNKIIKNNQNNFNNQIIGEKLAKILLLCQFNNKNDIDELIINIIFEIFDSNPKDDIILKIIEEIVYILFKFDLYSSYHLIKFKNGRKTETSKIIYEYFNKIYNKEEILHIKEIIMKKLQHMIIDIKSKEKLRRIILAYTPPKLIDVSKSKSELKNIDNNESNSIKSLEEEDEDDDDDDDNSIFQLPKLPKQKIRSFSLSIHEELKNNNKNISKTINEGAFNKKLSVNDLNTKLILNNTKKQSKKINLSKSNNNNIIDYSSKIQQYRQHSSIRPQDEIIIFKGIINAKKQKSSKNLLKNKVEKKRSVININLTNVDKETCSGYCHLCYFIRKILVSMFKREIIFGIYKNYLLHCISEVYIMNKNLDFKINFSYHLMKREGPSRIRKRFNIRIDKLLNYEYDRTAFEKRSKKKLNNKLNNLNKNNNDNNIKEKSNVLGNKNNEEVISENEIEKIFMFYENKKKFISGNLLNFFNLGQIFNIDIISKLIDSNDNYQGAFNCLLFKGLSYIDSVFILGEKKIYILSSVNISSNNILYDAHFSISKRFWIVKNYDEILHQHCKYLNSYNINENIFSNNKNNSNQGKKQIFQKTLKGFWLYSFYYVEINELHKRKFLHQNNSIEIFLNNGKNYYLSFNIDLRDKVVKHIINNIKQSHQSKNISFFFNNNYNLIKSAQNEENQNNNNLIKKVSDEEINDNFSNITYEIQNESYIKNENMIFIMYNNLFLDTSKKYAKPNFFKNIFQKNIKKTKYSLAAITDINEIIEKSYDKWTNGHLDTFSYIMLINTISGRTYNDVAQYPVYPWIISNYTSKNLNLNDSKSYRNFLYPIYAQDDETRQNLKLNYENTDEDQKDFKYHSGSHYSNAGFVCYYLIRIKPFSQLAAEVQGEYFDVTDRLFISIESFYKINEKYQELIPEFFNLPETFININNFNIGLTSDGRNVDNVYLPPWSSNSPRIFCKILKKSLESQYVSMHINDWIDLIFGYKQKGSEAEKYCNVLREVCSGFNPSKDCENEIEIEQKINELCEMGIDPIQIFNKPHHKRERHQRIKAFFGRKIFLSYFKPSEEENALKHFDNNNVIKEMRKYYEYASKFISKGQGGLSALRICYEDDNCDSKEINNNMIYFIISGKKTLLPPSYKNYIQWNNDNSFFLIKPFSQIKYKFVIQHMKKQIINCIKISKDGSFIIIGYNNGVIEKYKLQRIWGPKQKKLKTSFTKKESFNNSSNNDSIVENQASHSSVSSLPKKLNDRRISNIDNILIGIKRKEIMNENLVIKKTISKKEKSRNGLFNTLFGTKNVKKNEGIKRCKQIVDDIDDSSFDEEENLKIIEELEKNILNSNIKISPISNEIFFDTQIPISTSNIINSDCIILNNNTGKFIQYNGYPQSFDIYSQNTTNENIQDKDNIKDKTKYYIPGYEIYSNNKNNINNIINKENHNNSLSKHYIIFLTNSSSRILSEISQIEICEPYSFMIIVDKLNNLYIYDNNTLELIKHIDCTIYFNNKIKYISICPYTGDFILASDYRIILMSINGVLITQMNDIKSKINCCFITSIQKTSSDLYLFTAHENGNVIISKLISNFNLNKKELLKTNIKDEINNNYNTIKIKNIYEVYHNAYDTNYSNNKNKDKKYKHLENNNNYSIIFDSSIKLKCSEYPIKYIKLTQDSSSLLCINSKNNLIKLNYDDFYIEKNKNKDKKNILVCDKCQNPINSSKTLCSICGKKLCPNCKIEKIIAEFSLRNPKPVCDDCSNLDDKNCLNLYDS